MDNDETATSPWTRPGFVAAAVVVALVLVLGGVLAIRGFGAHDDRSSAKPSTSPSTSADATAPTAPTAPAGGASVCGLKGVQMSGTVSKAPAATWAYQGTTAYPSSTEFGPAATTGDGVRTCFQHSVTGALFMAANAVVQGSDPAVATPWVTAVLGEGPFRQQLLTGLGSATASGGASRMSIAGFRVLHYDGDTARIDLAIRATAETSTVTVSGVYELVWQAGDWKISAEVPEPLNVAAIPDLAGYVSWGA